MNLWSRILRRPFAMARPNLSSKNSKSELNFKETNEIVNPYDIIDRNVSGLEHRSRLRELRRLKEQLFLDTPDLNSFKKNNSSFNSNDNITSKFNIEISYSTLSLFPGINCATELSLDPSVTICLKLESSNFSKPEIEKIEKLMNLSDEAEECRFTVSDFPLISQNKSRAVETLKTIINVAKNEKLSKKDINSLVQFTNTANSSKHKSPAKMHLEYPAEWLQGLQKKQNTD